MRTMAFLAMTAAFAAPPLLSPGTFVRDDEPTVGHAGPQSVPATVPSALQEPLAYTSSPVAATTYKVADSTLIAMQSPMGPMEFTTVLRATLAVSFEADPAGFRATAEVTEFTGATGNSQTGTRLIGGSAVGGALVAVVGPAGLVELVDTPERSREASQFTVFEELGYDLFPTMPARVVAAGDSWTDTVTLSSTSGGARTSSTSIRTFTVGEVVVVEGRSLQMIGVSATVETSTEMEQGRMAMEQSFSGTQTGNFFWDAEAGLLRAAQLMNDFTGEAKMGRAPATSVTLKRIQRIWREY